METQERRNQSLWTGTTPSTSYPPLKGDLTVDVAVVGGGITGLTTALLLKQAGMRVAVIEGNRIAAGSTGYTTAKITSLHDLIYAKLLDELGEERARIYGHANQAAIEQVAKLVDDLEIECDFTRAPAYTYTEKADQREAIEREAEASQRLGLPASLTTETELPFPVEAAVRFDHQAAFHPRAYALALAEAIDGDGSVVLEGTRVKDVDEEDGVCRLKTDHGTMTADQAVIATLLPILDRGGYFAKAAPARSYLIAVRQGGPLPEGMYLSCDSPTRSVRSATGISGDYLLVGGEGHKVGHDDDTTQRYEALEAWARAHYSVTAVDYRWSAQDYMPADDIPYIGKVTSGSERIFVGTGFKKWGMTSGTLAAMINADLILGRDNPWASLFDSTRVNLTHSAMSLVTANLDVAKQFVGDHLGSIVSRSVDDLSPGEGRIAHLDGERVAAYRDPDGVLHAVSPICTHMGCVVSWNSAETTWDCPCHGSRFLYDGRVIEGPAVEPLDVKTAPTDVATGKKSER